MSDLRAALRGLTTRGRCLISAGLALALCALVLGQRDLLRAAVFLLVLPLVAVSVVARTRYRLACTRSLDPRRVEAGRPTEVHLRLDNVSRLPSGVLLMEDALPYALGGRPRFVLDRVEPHGVRDVTYSVTSEQRGRFRIGPLSVRLSDPFGLCQLPRAFASSDELVVTPVLTPLPHVPLGGDWAGGGESIGRGLAASGSDDTTTREYRYGDDLRKVHWRSTARTGELMVRQEEQPFQSRATLLIDTRARAHRGEGPSSSFEYAVSAVASIGVALGRAGYALKVVRDDDRDVLPPAVPVTEGLLLDALADLGTSDGRGLGPAVERLRRGVDGVLVAVLGQLDRPTAERLGRLRLHSPACVAVLLDQTSWSAAPRGSRAAAAAAATAADDQTEAAHVLLAAGWKVVHAGAGVPLSAAWAGAGARGGGRAAPTRPDPLPAPGSVGRPTQEVPA